MDIEGTLGDETEFLTCRNSTVRHTIKNKSQDPECNQSEEDELDIMKTNQDDPKELFIRNSSIGQDT